MNDDLGFSSNRAMFGPVPTLSDASKARIQAGQDAALTQGLLRGDAMFTALQQAIHDLSRVAPAEHDVLIYALGIYVVKVGFIEPHAFLFQGHDGEGNETFVVAHFSQIVARVIYRAKQGPEKVLTGFWTGQA